jgi:RNA polymerase sigma-70 factor, ECF subfamily
MSKEVGRRNRAELTDKEAISLCRNGEIDAFEVLVGRYEKKMLNIAFRILGDYEEACETVQDTFLSAYRALGQFRGDAQFATWLTAILMNQSKNRLREMRNRAHREALSLDAPLVTENGEMAYDPPSPHPTIQEQLEREELREKIRACISSLDDEHKEVVVLREIQGFSYDEISAILKVPEGTVKSRLFRGREALRKCLAGFFGDLR